MSELWQEIWHSLSSNRLRTVLTGFSIAWGIFILTVLLGVGNGLRNGVSANFSDLLVNAFHVVGGRTTEAWAGFPEGRRIDVTQDDAAILESALEDVAGKDMVIQGPGSFEVSFKDRSAMVAFTGVTEKGVQTQNVTMLSGRFINIPDVSGRRSCAVISEQTARLLFGDSEAVGQSITTPFGILRVVGVCRSGTFGENSEAFIPISLAQILFRHSDRVLSYIVLLTDLIDSEEDFDIKAGKVRGVMSAVHTYSPQDKRAVRVSGDYRTGSMISKIFRGLDIFLWAVGLGTLFAGVVGVGNIMLVTVRERTREFGIRKAVGAKPSSIVRQVMLESVAVTAFFGYVGMILGVAAMEIFDSALTRSGHAAVSAGNLLGGMTLFQNPTLDLSIMVGATVTLVIAGTLAGLIPSYRAANIRTTEALNDRY